MAKYKSVTLAKNLSLFVPGLGSIYLGNYFKGILWAIPGVILLFFLIIINIWIAHLHALGGDKYVMWSRNPGASILFIIAGYILCGRYSSKEAVRDVLEYNARLKELEDQLIHKE